MDFLEIFYNVVTWMYKMVPVGIGLFFLIALGVIIANAVIERRGMPWEKAEKKAAKKAAQAEEKARRDFWAGNRV
ncbi:MAG: hypothetical protein IJ329_00790 [Clostridia bacterium]|nr:hypothetical protein [Clostridia bacterium]